MAFIDYYKILGVEKNIPQKDVKRAYLKRAKQFHPDLHPDDPKAKAKFQALNEAYAVINDPDKRAKYDQYGEHWKEAEAFGQRSSAGQRYSYNEGGSPFGGFDFSGFGSGGGFSSFFRDLFGGAGKSCGGSCNAGTDDGNMQAIVDIDMYTALLGGDVLLKLGNGAKIKLHVKPETQNGSKVRLRGKGYQRGNGTCGDMIVTFNVKLPTNLSQRQRDLLAQMRQE